MLSSFGSRSLLTLWAAARGALPGFAPANPAPRALLSRRLRATARYEARYTVQVTGSGIRHLEARGEKSQVTQVLLDGVRVIQGPWGVVVVEMGQIPREWVARSLPRPRVLEGLLSLRDLLAGGGMDVAVFSPDQGIEIFLDRWGELEIRSGSWWEPRFRALLEERGFRLVGGRLPSVEKRRVRNAGEMGDPRRVARICEALGFETSDAEPRSAGGDPSGS